MALQTVTPQTIARDLPARVIKAAWEWHAAAFGLLAVLPLLAIAALLIKIDSAGPVFYRQTRVGRDGVPFTLFKLRTMYVGSDRAYSSLDPDREPTKQRADPRVTRVGRVLRRASLDELPQLINILAGQMALIGPRPPLPHELPLYEPHASLRFTVRPGLTGLWQVSGRADLTWNEAGQLDVEYVQTWTLARDLLILVRTVPAVLGGRGAY